MNNRKKKTNTSKPREFNMSRNILAFLFFIAAAAITEYSYSQSQLEEEDPKVVEVKNEKCFDRQETNLVFYKQD